MDASDVRKRPFRVVVVGAGIAGLVLSNCLQRAGIEHVVLEKHRDIVYPSGASIGIWPNGSRLLQQLGCLESLRSACSEMTVAYNRIPDGRAIVVSRLFDEIIQRHGYRFLLLERKEFIRALYDNLPSQHPVRTGCAVSGIDETDDGVRVFLKDGSFEDGDMVVGCDGVSSTVRQIMWDKANAAAPNTISAAEKRSLTASYKCLVGLSPAMAGVEPGTMTVVHNDGFSFLIMTQPERAFFFVFIKLDRTYHWPAFPRYTAEDVEREAARVADLPINDTVLFGELWARRLRGELVNLEEGVFAHWHAGRVVLAGDAAHKFTPNIAFGGNAAMESVAALANGLQAALAASADGLAAHPRRAELAAVFAAYQTQRAPRVRRIFGLSGLLTRVQAWDGWPLKAVARFVFPWVGDARVADLFAAAVRGGVALDYVPLPVGAGTVPWDGAAAAAGAAAVAPRGLRRLLAAVGALVLSYVMLQMVMHRPATRGV